MIESGIVSEQSLAYGGPRGMNGSDVYIFACTREHALTQGPLHGSKTPAHGSAKVGFFSYRQE